MFEKEKIKLAIKKPLVLTDYDRFWMITAEKLRYFMFKQMLMEYIKAHYVIYLVLKVEN